MPFQKGNQLWKKGLKARKEKDRRLNDIFVTLVDGGIEYYGDMLNTLANKQSLTDEEKEFMDRLEKMFEYVQPKLARSEHTGKGGKELPQPILSVVMQPEDKKK